MFTRHIIACLVILLPVFAHAQTEELVYFSEKDPELVGVKTTDGKVIIPPKYGHLFSYTDEKITQREILLLDGAEKSHDSMKYDYRMKIFDRKGKFMYSPYWVDNGPDFYVEGLRRYVENGKMGFADRTGKKIIAAKYSYCSPFYRGYAAACLDCRYTRFNNDEEHCCGYTGTKYLVIDRAGKVAFNPGTGTEIEINDSLLTAARLIHPFSAKEKGVLSNLEKLSEVKQFMRHNPGTYSEVIAEKPKDARGFFLVVFRSADHYEDELSFLVSDNGKSIIHLDHLGDEQSLNEWRKGR